MKKIIMLSVGIGIIIIIVIIGWMSVLIKRQNSNKIKGQITEQSIGKINNFENSRLIETAKQYILKKPLEFNADSTKASPEWITSQKVSVRYVEPNKYNPPYDELNDKYIVSWFFIPGCEENPSNSNKPNWFNKSGYPCLGGYNLDVIINPDGTVNRAELIPLN